MPPKRSPSRATATDLLKSDHNASVMVLGDLNHEVGAATTQILNGPTGSEIGTGGFSRKYRGRKELIDHIFVSHALVGKIAQDHVTTDAAGPTPSIDDDPTKRRGAPGSDHRPVLASIDV